MEKYKTRFNKGKKRAYNREYNRISDQISDYKTQIDKLEINSQERKELIQKVKELRNQRSNVSSVNFLDNNFKRLNYVRYADDFIIGIIGSKEEMQEVKSDIEKFLKIELKVELSKDKTLITHSSKFARFLGYNLTISRDNSSTRYNGIKKRQYKGKGRLYLPKEVWVEKLKELGALKIDKNGV